MISLKKIIRWSLYLLASFSIAFLIASIIIVFIIQPICVDGYSMESTLRDKEKILIDKLPHTFNIELNYGDIVAFDSRINKPHTITTDLIDYIKYGQFLSAIFNKGEPIYRIKRVIGKPGDTLELKNETVIRNGKVLKEPYIRIFMNYTSNIKITVPQNHIFVMGDNRNNSVDSKDIGCIPLDHVIGKYVFKFG